MTAIDFETKISRIEKAFKDLDAEVTWNDRIKDPDTNQSRQIDITVKKNGFLTIIECRLHKEKQNSKWIEELIGRKVSLRAEKIIGVSSSGFTKPAILKAQKFGIELKILQDIKEETLPDWFKSARIHLRFYKIESMHFVLKMAKSTNLSLTSKEIFKCIENNVFSYMNTLRTNIDSLNTLETVYINHDTKLDFELLLFNEKIENIFLRGEIIPYEKIYEVQNVENYSQCDDVNGRVLIQNFENNAIEVFKKDSSHLHFYYNFKKLIIPKNTMMSNTFMTDNGGMHSVSFEFSEYPVISPKILFDNFQFEIIS